MSKNSFILYYNHKEIFDELDDAEAGRLIKAIFEYEINGITPKEKLIKAVMVTIKQVLDDNKQSYEQICLRNQLNGRLGGRPKKTQKTQMVILETQQNPKNLDIDIDTDIDINNKKRNIKEKFKKPTLEELEEYKKEINGTVDVQHFIDYYESNGWLVGKNHMKDWKATYRNWNRKQQPIKSNEIIPEWVGKEIEEKEANEEQILEMERMLSKYR